MKPFTSDGCCQPVCLSASESNLVSVFLCRSTTKSLSCWIQYSCNIHNERSSHGRTAYLGNLYSQRTAPAGLPVSKASHEQRTRCSSVHHSKTSQAKAMAAGRATASTREQPCSCLALATENQRECKHTRKVRSHLEPLLSLTSFLYEVKHVGDWEWSTVPPICRLSSLRKKKEKSVCLVTIKLLLIQATRHMHPAPLSQEKPFTNVPRHRSGNRFLKFTWLWTP